MTARLPSNVDLKAAEGDFAVANTPLFLLRKLRMDESVQRLAHTTPSTKLLRLLSDTLKVRPRSLRASVVPYVCLVALSLRGDFVALRKASKFRAPYSPWYKYLAEVIMQTAIPTNSWSTTSPISAMKEPAISSSESAISHFVQQPVSK